MEGGVETKRNVITISLSRRHYSVGHVARGIVNLEVNAVRTTSTLFVEPILVVLVLSVINADSCYISSAISDGKHIWLGSGGGRTSSVS